MLYSIVSSNGIVVIGLSNALHAKVYANTCYGPEMCNKQKCSPIVLAPTKCTSPDLSTWLKSSLFPKTNRNSNSSILSQLHHVSYNPHFIDQFLLTKKEYACYSPRERESIIDHGATLVTNANRMQSELGDKKDFLHTNPKFGSESLTLWRRITTRCSSTIGDGTLWKWTHLN
jgi:hypothetical protein